MKLKTTNTLKIFCLIAVIFFYFFGFFLREKIAGGAESDFI